VCAAIARVLRPLQRCISAQIRSGDMPKLLILRCSTQSTVKDPPNALCGVAVVLHPSTAVAAVAAVATPTPPLCRSMSDAAAKRSAPASGGTTALAAQRRRLNESQNSDLLPPRRCRRRSSASAASWMHWFMHCAYCSAVAIAIIAECDLLLNLAVSRNEK
jgi:hypothetical protein